MIRDPLKKPATLRAFFLFCLALAGPAGGFCQEATVPVQTQYPLFLKILTFDRNLKKRSGKEIVLGIVYQKRFRSSLTVQQDLSNAIASSTVRSVSGIPIRCVSIDLSEAVNLMEEIDRNGVNVLYLAPVRALSLGAITSVSRTRQIVTLAGLPEYVASGLSVGIEEKEGTPRILIGLGSARAEGVDFSSQLLKLARVIP